MHKLSFLLQPFSAFISVFIFLPVIHAAAAKPHSVVLGSARKAVYVPADAAPAPDTPGAVLRIRALMVDGRMKEWTTGDSHDVTDRSFTVRRAVRVNDALPGETQQRWIWQPGPWLLVDRQTGHIALLHLPDYDPSISDVAWFRDYAAYCGVGNTAKTLFAVVARAGTAKPLVQKEIARWQPAQTPQAACAVPVWHRAPIRVSFQPIGHDAVSFEVTGMAASVLEEAPDNDN